MKEYLGQSKSRPPDNESSFEIKQEYREEFANGLRINFNFILGSQLLYKFERPQYAALLKSHSNAEMTDIYGPMHLLRLLGILAVFST